MDNSFPCNFNHIYALPLDLLFKGNALPATYQNTQILTIFFTHFKCHLLNMALLALPQLGKLSDLLNFHSICCILAQTTFYHIL